MATKTSVGSGLWSAAGTWDAGVPVDNDAVVIANGHVVEFDVDQSGFANGIDGLTITGTLSLTRTAGTYYLKIKAGKTINGAGTFDCGTLVSPIPFASKHTVAGGAAWRFNSMANSITITGTEPIYKHVRLLNPAGAGSTVLEIDTDVTGDIWEDGNEILICDINTNDKELRTIAVGGISSGSITITSGLTNAKLASAYVVLKTRNVTFTGNGGYFGVFYQCHSILFASGDIEGNSQTYGFNYCNNVQVSGGILSEITRAMYACNNVNITGGYFVGLQFGGCNGIKVSGGYFLGSDASGAGLGANSIVVEGGVITGNYYGLSYSSPATVTGITISGNSYGLMSVTGKLINTILSLNAVADIVNGQFTSVNTLFNSSVEFIGYKYYPNHIFSESFDHDQIAGAYKCWTNGGITTSQASVLPTGFTKAFITVLESATVEGYWQREITVGAGASVNIEIQLRKDASMTYLPRAIIFNKASIDPFAGGAGLHTFTMTDSVDTWEDDLYTYTNSGTEDVTLVIRCQGMNATGNLYSALDVEQINVDLTGAIAKIDVIDALVDAIKAKTDQLAFTVANQVDANSLTGGLTEGQIRTAIGLAAANLDTQLAVIPTAVENRQEMDSNSTRLASIDGKTTNLPADPADQSAVEAAITAIPAGISVNDILGMQVEGTYTLQQILRIMSSALAGKLSGGGTATLKFRDLQDTLDRITATVDQATGDRDNITLDLS